jgi:perosamine synthetase
MFRWSPHPRYRLYTGPATYRSILRVLLFGQFRAGNDVARLEADICRRFGAAAAVCVPNARAGLYLALEKLIRPGQAVVLSPLTIVDVVNMVLLAGGVPVFADVLRQSCTIDPDSADSLIDRHTGAMIVTHLHGETAGACVFREICRRRGVPLIEDAAQAFGAMEEGRRLGTIGDVGVYSFGLYKNVNALQGGMVVSRDLDLVGRIRRRIGTFPFLSRRSVDALGMQALLTDVATWPPLFARLTYPVVRHATLRQIRAVTDRLDPEHGAARLRSMPAQYLERMTSLQAALALPQLDRVDAESEERISHAARYDRTLSTFGGLITPHRRDGLAHIYTYYPVQCENRDALLRHAFEHGRDIAPQYLRNCADLPEFREFHRDCPNARAAARELILLPTYPRYPVSEIDENIEVIRGFLNQRTGERRAAETRQRTSSTSR